MQQGTIYVPAERGEARLKPRVSFCVRDGEVIVMRDSNWLRDAVWY